MLDFLEELYDENSFVIEIKDELKELKDRVLNPSAHNSDEPLFEEEVNDAINTIDKITKSLKKIKENKEKQKSVQNINKKTEHKTEIKIKDNIENKVIIDFENDFTKKIILLTNKNDLNNFLINNVYENIILFTEKETEEFLNQLLIKANLLDDSSFVNLTHIVDKITKNKQLTTNIKLIFGKFAYEITNITKEINKKSFVNILFNYGCVVNHNCLFNKYYTILFDGIINQTIEMDIDDILFNQFIEILNNNEERHGNLVDYKIINKSFELILRKLKTNDKHFIDDISVFETLRKNNLHIVLNEFIRNNSFNWLNNNSVFIVEYFKSDLFNYELIDIFKFIFNSQNYSTNLLNTLYNYFINSYYDYYNDDNPKYKELMDFVKNKFEEDIPF